MVNTELITATNLDVFLPLIPGVLQAQSVREEGIRFYGVDVDGVAAGIVATRPRADSMELTYMYLLPDYRRMGYMDHALADIMFRLKSEGFSGIIMDYMPEEYPALIRISQRFSFKEHSTNRAYFRFTVEQIRRCKAITYSPQGTMRLRALPESMRRNLYNKVDKLGYDMDHIIDDLTLRSSVEENSLVYMERENPQGLMLVQDMTGLAESDRITAFGRIFPEGSSADIALIYVGSTQIKAPLYLISALCKDILAKYEDNDVITGYFPYSHLTKLLEGTLGITGKREMTALLELDTLEKYDE